MKHIMQIKSWKAVLGALFLAGSTAIAAPEDEAVPADADPTPAPPVGELDIAKVEGNPVPQIVNPAPLPEPGLINVNYFEEVFIPNPNLRSETSDNFELGAHFEDEDFFGGTLSARLTGFYRRGEDTFDSEIVGGMTNGGFANPANVPTANAPFPFPPGSTATFFSGLNFDGQLEQVYRQTVNRVETEIYGFEFTLDYDRDLWFVNLPIGTLCGEDLTTGLALNSITGDQLATTVVSVRSSRSRSAPTVSGTVDVKTSSATHSPRLPLTISTDSSSVSR